MKRIVIILVLISILCFLITATLIILKRDSLRREQESKITTESDSPLSVQLYKEFHLPIEDDIQGASLSQVYDTNPIRFTRHKYEDEKIVGYYFKIDGLLDESIESVINNKLKDRLIAYGNDAYDDVYDYYYRKANGLLSEYEYVSFSRYGNDGKYYNEESLDDSWKIHVGESIMYNGANAISIMISEDDSYYSSSKNDYININLVNGEDIKIEELFTKNISAKELYAQSIYTNFGTGEILYDEYDTWTDSDGETYSYGMGTGTYEDVDTVAIEKLVKKFRYSEDVKFGFSDGNIVIIVDDDYRSLGNIEMGIIANDIALFNRFLSDKNIFDNNYNKVTNVPAFNCISKGDNVKYAKLFEKNDKVVLNYLIEFNGDYESEAKFTSIINYAIDQINGSIKSDVSKINKYYSGNNYIMYSGIFKIELIDVNLKDSDKVYENFINVGNTYMHFDYDPNVQEISKTDLAILQSDYYSNVNYYYNYVDYSSTEWIKSGDDWVPNEKYVIKKYEPFYRDIRNDIYVEEKYTYSDGSYFDNVYNDYYLMTNNIKILSENELKNSLIKDRENLAKVAYELNPKIWDYDSIDRDNYKIEVYLSSDMIQVCFPYYEFNTYWSGWSDARINIDFNTVENEASIRSPYNYYEWGVI